MRKRTLGVVLAAGLALSGAGAFTASNTVPDSVYGYGAAAVTGATVTDITYNTNALDNSLVDSVVFTTVEDLTLTTSTLVLTNAGVDLATPSECVAVTTVLTCTFGTVLVPVPASIDSFDGIELTVVD